jgi:hypothetical protein
MLRTTGAAIGALIAILFLVGIATHLVHPVGYSKTSVAASRP